MATVVWFRRDLRLDDNPALAEAVRRGGPVVPIYVFDEALEGRPLGGASRWWLDKSLRALGEDLARRGAPLTLRRGSVETVLPAFLRETGAATLVFNRLFEPAAAERDRALVERLERAGVETAGFNGTYLHEPGSALTGQGSPYKVFTPFSRAVLSALPPPDLHRAPERLEGLASPPASERLEDWGLHPTSPDWSAGFADWTPGEAGAQARLETFLDERLEGYAEMRDRPDVEGTSRLSPHLHWGEIAPQRVRRYAEAAAETGAVGGRACETLVKELLWREFSAHLLHAFPDLAERPLRREFERFPWRDDPEAVNAWRRGRTGYPLVDAGLRQLWATGWMHNRVRMVAASFLIKHLLIDWREGLAWFHDTLVDADQANNAASWQWVAGSGADAAPFFRIFNPVGQGERFDPQGRYVRRWVPELSALPDRWIHAPWTAPAEVLDRAGVRLGETYPRPIVDHGRARTAALSALASLKEAGVAV